MNADALSDLVLLAACAASAWRVGSGRAAWRGAMLLLGMAAAMGVLRYSGLAQALGPHRFFSLLAACVAFWLMAVALRWPQAPLASQATAVGRFVVLLGGLGIAASQVGAGWWAQVVPGLSALVLVWTMVQQRSALGLLGSAALVVSFVVAALATPDAQLLGLFNKTQALHYLLALAVLVLGQCGQSLPRRVGSQRCSWIVQGCAMAASCTMCWTWRAMGAGTGSAPASTWRV